MITSITQREYPFILESDRTNIPENQTVFYIVPKTVRGQSVTAANYSKVQIENKRKGKKEIDVAAMQLADVQEWLRAVKKVENFGVLPNCPGATDLQSGYDHFMLKAEKDPSQYTKQDDGLIVVKSTTDETDLKCIMYAMSPADQEEVMEAYFNFSSLKESTKNE